MNKYTAVWEDEGDSIRIECWAEGDLPYAELKNRATSGIDAARMLGNAMAAENAIPAKRSTP